MRRLLVLRPEPGASATLERAFKLGFDAFSVPLFKIEPLDWVAPDPRAFDALLLTSANAVLRGGKQLDLLRSLPVYAVGEATADAARDAGFEIEESGRGSLDDLLGMIDRKTKLLHLCARDRGMAPPREHAIEHVEVYRAQAVENPDLRGAEGSVALVHSPRAGRRFAELAPSRGSICIAAISRAAAEASQSGWAALEFASEPSDDGLLALAARLCDIPPLQ